ncbi:1345_t:CDS:2 [Ambispora leptoticha]|uniref:1345_t:CDS:1 n=1 Tax=Ambispora leptoticha TaxID=144679 RepID=A0A9N9B4B6_9GLOM|nr:1345_t:CDS:2 [Ambispora leptoticha]
MQTHPREDATVTVLHHQLMKYHQSQMNRREPTADQRDNATYSSSSELANITSALNISASRNDSDFSMSDVGGSQPPSYMESINEES